MGWDGMDGIGVGGDGIGLRLGWGGVGWGWDGGGAVSGRRPPEPPLQGRQRRSPGDVADELLVVHHHAELTRAGREDVQRLREHRQLLTGSRRQNDGSAPRLRHTVLPRLHGRQPMGNQWATNGQPMGKRWATDGQTVGNQWANGGQPMGKRWANGGQPMGNQWAIGGQTVGNQWANSGQPMGKQWATDGQPMGN